jgi:peptide/nickel transport system ATP-binding protein
MLLEVHDLSVTYAGARPVRAVRRVSFTLDGGETLGVAGESGSGKTTVALALLRLLPSAARIEGSVKFQGEELTTANWGRLRAVRWDGASVVFQGAMGALNPVRTIGWQIREAIVQHERAAKGIRRRIEELLESVGIPGRRYEAYPHELSGGQRQRVMIAMALACRPDLIIADEPTTALDVIVQGQVLALLGDLVRESGIGMIMISHDLSVLAETCASLAVMYAGELVEHGPSRELVRDPRHPYTEGLAAAFPKIGDPASRLAPAGLPGDPPDASVVLPGCSFAPRCPVVMDECTSAEIELWESDPAHPGRRSACLRVLGGAPESTGAPVREGTPSRMTHAADFQARLDAERRRSA